MNEDGTVTVVKEIEVDVEDFIDDIVIAINDFFDSFSDGDYIDTEDRTELVKMVFDKVIKERM